MAKLEKIEGEVGLYKYPLANNDFTYYFKYKDTHGKTQDVKVGRHSESFRIKDARNQRTTAIAKNKDNPESEKWVTMSLKK